MNEVLTTVFMNSSGRMADCKHNGATGVGTIFEIVARPQSLRMIEYNFIYRIRSSTNYLQIQIYCCAIYDFKDLSNA